MDRHIPQDGLCERTEDCRYAETVPSDAGRNTRLTDLKVPVQTSALYEYCVRTVLHGDGIVEGVLARARQGLARCIYPGNEAQIHQVLKRLDHVHFGKDRAGGNLGKRARGGR